MLVKLVNEGFKLALDGRTAEAVRAEPTPATLRCGRKGRTALQVLLHKEGPWVLRVGTEPWFTQKGPLPSVRLAVEAPFPVRLWIEGLMRDDDQTPRADLLLPHPVLETAGWAAVYVEGQLPTDAAPGRETLRLRLYQSAQQGDEALLQTLEMPIEVLPFTQPSAAESGFYLDLWQHSANIARKHEMPLWSPEHFALLEGYLRALGTLGQKSVTVLVSDAPWRGQSCQTNTRNPSNLFEYGMLRLSRGPDRELHADFSVVDAYVALCERCGITGDIELLGFVGIWPNKAFDGALDTPVVPGDPEPQILLRVLDTATGAYGYLHQSAEVDWVIAQTHAHFARKGWLQRARVAADEPSDMARYAASLERVRRVAPGFRFKTAINHADFVGRFGQEIDDFIPSLESLSREYAQLTAYRESMEGKRFLWYVCCAPRHPNTFLRSPLVQTRLIGWLTDWFGFDGFLRWNFTVWPEHPRQELRYGDFSAGDTNFIYPGYGGQPVLTLRYKALQRGIEDWALLRAAREAGRGDEANEALRRVLCAPSPEALFAEGLLPMERIAAETWAAYDEALSALRFSSSL